MANTFELTIKVSREPGRYVARFEAKTLSGGWTGAGVVADSAVGAAEGILAAIRQESRIRVKGRPPQERQVARDLVRRLLSR